jgi:hypothetical protein
MADAQALFCGCGRSFKLANAFSNHQRQCKKTKKRLSSALDKAKELWTAKKRRCVDQPWPSSSQDGNQAAEVGRSATPTSLHGQVCCVLYTICVEVYLKQFRFLSLPTQ